MSKAKVIDTTVRVDLLLQNAQTGEYLASGSGQHTLRQNYSGGLSGGQTGTWDTSSGDTALDMAIGRALFELIHTFSGVNPKYQQRPGKTPTKQTDSGIKLN